METSTNIIKGLIYELSLRGTQSKSNSTGLGGMTYDILINQRIISAKLL